MSNKISFPHYSSLNFVSSLCNGKDKKSIDYGKSNTDQSFYEPMSSLISSQMKIGVGISSLLSDGKSHLSTSEIFKTSNFLNKNMTFEETNVYLNHVKKDLEKQNHEVSEQIKAVNEQVKSIIDSSKSKENIE